MLNDNCLEIPEPGKLPGRTRKLPFIFTGYHAMRENPAETIQINIKRATTSFQLPSTVPTTV
jgi:hypothetical protein